MPDTIRLHGNGFIYRPGSDEFDEFASYCRLSGVLFADPDSQPPMIDLPYTQRALLALGALGAFACVCGIAFALLRLGEFLGGLLAG